MSRRKRTDLSQLRQSAMLKRAFSLIELLIVITIIAILAAVAVPRFSRGAESARENALKDNLTSLNKAAELYAIEHGGAYPDPALVVEQLAMFTDQAGAVAATKSAPAIFGPYLRCIPPMPIGPQRGAREIGESPGPGIAWVYSPSTGQFTANLDP
jgi:general secretion pathway protein G